jgi:hypothetical protein
MNCDGAINMTDLGTFKQVFGRAGPKRRSEGERR